MDKHSFKLTSPLVYVTLILLVANSTMASDLYLPSLPSIVNAFSTTEHYAQLTLVSYMIGFAISMLISGPLSDLFGIKKIILVGISIQFLATICCLLSPSITYLIVFRFIQALGGCCGTVLARVMVKNHSTKTETVRILSVLSAGLAIAFAIAPIMGGFLQKSFEWHASFIIIALISILLFLLCKKFIPSDESSSKRVKYKDLLIAKIYKSCLSNKEFNIYTIIIGFILGGYFSFISSSAFIFMIRYSLSPVKFGFVYSLMVLSYVIGSHIAKRWSPLFSIKKAVKIASLIAMASALFMIVSLSVPQAVLVLYMISFAIFILSTGILMPNCQAGALEKIHHGVGTSAGLFYFFEMMIGAIFGYALTFFPNVMQGTLCLGIISACVVFIFSKWL